MRSSSIILVLCFVVHSKCLECGLGRINSDEIKKSLSTCVKNNETLEKIWEMASSSSANPSSSSESDSSSMEDEQPHVKSARMSRLAKRDSNVQLKTIAPPTEEPNEKSTVAPGDSTTPSPDTGDTCIVHCVFKQVGMTDDNGLPDHTKIVEGLLKNAEGRELRIFLQEAAGECFQEVDKESNMDPCTHSNKLIRCLANKGRLNCEDWPAGSLPI